MADNNRFADAIKRIVEPLIPEQTGDDNYSSKSPIFGKRGIALNNGTTQATSGALGAASAANTNRPRTVIQQSSDALQTAAIKEALNSLGSLGSDQGSYDAKKLLTGEDSPAVMGTVDAATLAALALNAEVNSLGTASGGGRLLEITGLKDCVSGKEMTIRTDGFYIPPSTWAAEDEPPEGGTGWDSNHYWVATNFAGSSQGASFWEAGYNQMRNTIGYNGGSYVVTDTRYISSTYDIGNTVADFTIEYFVFYGPGDPSNAWISNNITCTQNDCVSPGNPSSYCVLTEPTTSFVPWPYRGYFQVSRQGDQSYIANFRDLETPTNFSTPRSIIAACTADDDTPVRVAPLKNGGFAFYEVDGGGAVTGVVQLYNADSSAAGFTDVAGLSRMTP